MTDIGDFGLSSEKPMGEDFQHEIVDCWTLV